MPSTYWIAVAAGGSLGLYWIFMLMMLYGWSIAKRYRHSTTDPSSKVSVIVPARNEEHNIEGLLSDLIDQNYPADLYEVIVVDDHSTDRTASKAQAIADAESQVSIQLLSPASEGKKAHKKKALETGIRGSNGELILTTDADCRLGKNWIRSFAECFESESPDMIVGPVQMTGSSWFQQMQALEMTALGGVTAATIGLKQPTMANGANLGYTRAVFNLVNGFEEIDNISSGDDVLLLHKVKKLPRTEITYLPNPEATVTTQAELHLRGFIQQRVRWASKIKAYRDGATSVIGVLIFAVNAVLTITLLLSLANNSFFEYFLIGIVGKFSIDLFFLYRVTSFFKRSKLLLLALPAQLLYLLYAPLIGILSLRGRYRWKGRTVS